MQKAAIRFIFCNYEDGDGCDFYDDDYDYDGDGDSGGEYFDGQSTQEAMVIDNSAELCHDLHVLQMPQNNV